MASYHLSVKTVSRSAGRSATAAAAYRSGSLIACEREGRVHDYTRKAGVEDAFILAPNDAPAWAGDRAALWNAAEARETRSNSVTAREWELALPSELGADERRVLVTGFARELVSRYGVAADVAIHAPHRDGDQRNHHAHVLTTTRAFTAEGLGDKTRVLDAKQTGGPEIELMRARWAEMQNHALEQALIAAGFDEGPIARVDHRSLAAQRADALERGQVVRAEQLDRAPEIKLGPAANAVERREKVAAAHEGRAYEPQTERGAVVEEIRQLRDWRARLAELGARMKRALGLGLVLQGMAVGRLGDLLERAQERIAALRQAAVEAKAEAARRAQIKAEAQARAEGARQAEIRMQDDRQRQADALLAQLALAQKRAGIFVGKDLEQALHRHQARQPPGEQVSRDGEWASSQRSEQSPRQVASDRQARVAAFVECAAIRKDELFYGGYVYDERAQHEATLEREIVAFANTERLDQTALREAVIDRTLELGNERRAEQRGHDHGDDWGHG